MLGFLFLASSQGNFFAQQKGGKPIIPIPPDMVLTYELLILGGVYITVLGFLISAACLRAFEATSITPRFLKIRSGSW